MATREEIRKENQDIGALFRALVSAMKERALFRTATMGFDQIILIFMAILLVGSALAMGGRIRLLQATVLLPVIILSLALYVKSKRYPDTWRDNALTLLRDWVPFLLIVFIYENLHDVAGQTMSFDIAGTLYNMDVAIFGIEPTIWVQRIHSPLLTDLMSMLYALYFAEPLFIMFLLSIWGLRYKFRHMALALTITFIMGFLGYVLLPASPPRYFMEHAFTDPIKLNGYFIFNHLQGAWDSLSVISGGAFPSLHVALSSVALIYAYKYRNVNRLMLGVFIAYVPLVIGLWFSTVYLRHHWVIDIFAGWFVAILAYFGAGRLMRVWGALRQRYSLPF